MSLIESLTGVRGYVLIFLGSILEGDATLLTAAFLAHRQHFSLSAVMATAGLASTLANEVYFLLARRGGKAFLDQKVAHHPRYAKVGNLVRRRAVVLLLVSRYLIGFRLAIPVACGAFGMPRVRYTVVNVAGAILWAVPLALVGYAFGNVLETFWTDVRRYEWQVAGILITTAVAILVWRDPELHGLASALLHTHAFTLRSAARVRRLLVRSSKLGLPGGDIEANTQAQP
ncbi:MAG TPA: DedA family protein [Bryobacteraceae bacterium]|nr:DedA family protein [Bryobacteraceae bacterium]